MAEFIGEKENNVNIGEPVVFENKTDSAFEVSVGVVFHKSGIYEVSVLKNKTIVSKVTEQKRGKWNFIGDNMFECTSCRVAYTTQQLEGLRNYNTDPYAPKFCPNCGADMRGEQDG